MPARDRGPAGGPAPARMTEAAAAALPRYADLPVEGETGERTAWGAFGADDEIGTLNLLTDDRVAAAAAEVRTGRRFSLNLPVTLPDPPIGGGQANRGVPRRHVERLLHGGVLDDRLDELWLQGSTQWDGLNHVRHRRLGFYNGADPADVEGEAARLGIHRWQPGVVGRGVLLDLPRWAAGTGRPLAWDDPFPVTPEVIEAVLAHQGLELRPGDVLLLRTGWLEGFLRADAGTQRRLATEPGLTSPGLHPTDEVIELLWDHQVAAVAADNPSVEVTPPQGTGFGHWKLIPLFGLALGELWWLEDLADDCEADGRWSSLVVSVPLNVPGACGSPANAIAIK